MGGGEQATEKEEKERNLLTVVFKLVKDTDPQIQKAHSVNLPSAKQSLPFSSSKVKRKGVCVRERCVHAELN